MPKKLTDSQINELYTFTQSTGVHYYDLQTELVDHLANDIEEQWSYNQNPDFESAVAAAYRRFDTNGFNILAAQRKKLLGKRYARLITKCFIEFFTPPKIILTVAVFFGWYYLMQYESLLLGVLFIIMQFFTLFRAVMQRNRHSKKTIVTGKRWLLEELIYNSNTFFGFIGVSLQVPLLAMNEHILGFLLYLLPLAATLFTLHNYIALYAIPAKAKHYLKETYPEYGLA